MNVNKIILIGNLGREPQTQPVLGESRYATVFARMPINIFHVDLIDEVAELYKIPSGEVFTPTVNVTHKDGVVDFHIEDVQDRGGGQLPVHEGATGPPRIPGRACTRPRMQMSLFG